ncbi:MAG: 3,4-dihydroxy-2-butanone-4-phosphate synthase [Flavobacteriales bacterium]
MKEDLNDIEEALADIQSGRVVIVVDDEDRENEGDFVTAARNVTPETINFMAKHGRGLICAPLVEERCEALGLNLMVSDNTALHETPFTVSVDLNGYGCTTGISANDRARTVQALIHPDTVPEDLGKPGHIFPLKAREGGVLRRTGHTEATIDLARLAGYEAGGVLVEIMNDDGSMARLPELLDIAERFGLKIVSIEDLISYRMANESLIQREIDAELPEEAGGFRMIGYRQTTTGEEHLALVKGEWKSDEPVLVRVHSSDLLRQIYTYKHDPHPPQLRQAMQAIEEEGKGAIVFMRQMNRGNLIQRIRAYKNADNVGEHEEALGFKMDEKDFGVGAQILHDLGVRKMRLLTNHPTKRTGLIGYGLEIVENVPIQEQETKRDLSER